ncbi:TetR/AcrR family transcriptional regulator [Paenibacillus oryzisoli]|uniref:TetR/AcrR family transcriptional regulator n=1 Tax=Paenibacillus oryzisoli TaxID=1850517 RepID=UPI003D2D2FDA
MKNEERRELTTGRLLTAVKQLIAEKGCEALTMKDLMERSGLSKGAIFHYVKSKDEIFAWVLQERLESTNEQFQSAAEQEPATFEGPMQRIANGMMSITDPGDVTNKVFIYLLGKEADPAVAEALQQFYEQSIRYSKMWIVAGQQHGVIHASLDADETAETFVLLTLGLRVRSMLPIGRSAGILAEKLSGFMARILKA